jgi:crossover junction endodeoxyribonuclease RuvC
VLSHSAARKTTGKKISPRRTLGAVSSFPHSNDRPLCVLGVDPAVVGATGYGVVQSDGRRCEMLRFGAWRPAASSRAEGEEHLCGIHRLITELIQEYAPHGVAIEAVFTALNIKTALRLAEVRGVVLLAAAQAGIPSFSYTPREVKANVAGYGNAGKEQVQQMVRALLHMSETPEPADAADALAIALCHVQAAETRARWAISATAESPRRRNGARRVQSYR